MQCFTNYTFSDNKLPYQGFSYHKNHFQNILTSRKYHNFERIGKPVGVAWRAVHSRQAVHSRKPRKWLWRYESPGGPSMPPGGFWKFPETW